METHEHKGEQTRFSGRALIVEDTRTNQILMKALLGKLGLEVAFAGDGCEAVQKALSETFDVIFMDIQMPNMDGYQATRALREQRITVPIIALTAHTSDADEAQCLDAGCDDYLSKPVDRSRLIEKLGKYLSSTDTRADTCAPPESQADLDDRGAFGGPSTRDDSDAGMCRIGAKPVIDWGALSDRGFDEALVLRVMPICIEDNRERLQKLAVALRTHNIEDVRLYAHAMKGSLANVGAVELAQVACRLEEQAKRRDLAGAEHLLSSMEEGFQELQSLVSKPNWTKTAKWQTQPVIAPHGS